MNKRAVAAYFSSLVLFGLTSDIFATVHYVDSNGNNPAAPFTSWSTAATNIQDAIDVASAGDLVLVTNGVYQTGGRVAVGTLTNRVAVNKALTVQSVNGPSVTTIQGYQVPDTTNDVGAIRCVYLTNGASLYGFTLANGATLPSGSSEADGAGAGIWAESLSAVASNCIISGNVCHVFANLGGGGAINCTLLNCVLIGNRARTGGGAFGCALTNCVLQQNIAPYGGAAVVSSVLVNCTVAGNFSVRRGSGSCATGGALNCTLFNSIVYFNYNCNFDWSDYSGCNFYACCIPTNNPTCVTNEPLFVDLAGGNLRLQSNSPCINFGNNTYAAQPTDLDANPRIAGGIVDIGAFEYVMFPLTHYVSVSSSNPLPPFTNWATAATSIQDAIDVASAWDLVLVTNGVYQTGGRVTVGTLTNRVAVTKPLTVQSVNGPLMTTIRGYQVPGVTNDIGAIRCVYLTTGASLYGFTLTNGATLAASDPSNYTNDLAEAGIWADSTRAVASNCVINGNACAFSRDECAGGGARNCTLKNCLLIGNRARIGGGAFGCALTNCVLWTNASTSGGGGAASSTLINCTVAANRSIVGPPVSGSSSPGAYNCLLMNSIVYSNYLSSTFDGNPSDCSGCTFFYCCVPPTNGSDYISDYPIYVDLAEGNLRLQSNSPCINAGKYSYIPGMTDLDGNPRISAGAIDIGAYEFQNPPILVPPTHYVSLTSFNATPPFTNWATAATSIQDAIDAAPVRHRVLVSNGVYQTGGRIMYGAMSNRVAVTKEIIVESLNGPATTVIQGYQVPGTVSGDSAVRCVYLAKGATLKGFTLKNGSTRDAGDGGQEQGGGGIWADGLANVLNCVLVSNYANAHGGGAVGAFLDRCTLNANWSGYSAGGASGCTIYNSIVSSNNAYLFGGGAEWCFLVGCTVVGNWVLSPPGTPSKLLGAEGGGIESATAINCILYYNTAPYHDNYSSSALTNCCTTPDPGAGNNITNPPLFIASSGSNLRLQSNSPCINMGDNSMVQSATDLDGRPRITGGTVDIGAYEFQSAAISFFIQWLQQYGLPMDSSADYADSDGDHMNNWQEWLAGTIPTDASSMLRVSSPFKNQSGLLLSWSSVTNRNYFLERATNLASSFQTIASGIPGQPSTTSYTDTNPPSTYPLFYRVGTHP